MIPSAVFYVAVAQQNKIPLSNKFSRNLGNMPKTYTYALSTSGKYMAGFLVKSFGECCRSSLWYWRPSVTGRQVTVFLLTIGVGGVKLQPFTVVLDSNKGVYCHHSSSYSISGSRNYTPQAKSDPRSQASSSGRKTHFPIWKNNIFTKNVLIWWNATYPETITLLQMSGPRTGVQWLMWPSPKKCGDIWIG